MLPGLVDRGLEGVRSMVSDDHEGIKLAGELSGVDRQKCFVYFERNVLAHVPASWTEEVDQDLPLLSCES
jgi:putative transposase